MSIACLTTSPLKLKTCSMTIEAMRKAGITITDEPFRLGATGSLIAFVEDPDGTLIELIEKPLTKN